MRARSVQVIIFSTNSTQQTNKDFLELPIFDDLQKQQQQNQLEVRNRYNIKSSNRRKSFFCW